MTSPTSTDDICAVVSIDSDDDDDQPIIVPVDDWEDAKVAPIPPEHVAAPSRFELKLRALLQ